MKNQKTLTWSSIQSHGSHKSSRWCSGKSCGIHSQFGSSSLPRGRCRPLTSLEHVKLSSISTDGVGSCRDNFSPFLDPFWINSHTLVGNTSSSFNFCSVTCFGRGIAITTKKNIALITLGYRFCVITICCWSSPSFISGHTRHVIANSESFGSFSCWFSISVPGSPSFHGFSIPFASKLSNASSGIVLCADTVHFSSPIGVSTASSHCIASGTFGVWLSIVPWSTPFAHLNTCTSLKMFFLAHRISFDSSLVATFAVASVDSSTCIFIMDIGSAICIAPRMRAATQDTPAVWT